MTDRYSSHAWGLADAPRLHGAAARTAARWRWPVVVSLLATIPAFYIELIEQLPTPLATAIYLLAAGVQLLSVWRVARLLDAPASYWRHNGLDLVLIVGLVLAALLPASTDSSASLALRLAVSFLTLLRLVWLMRPWVARGGLGYLLALAFGVLCICGVGFWVLEPQVHSLADGLWLAFTTAATVGYGDLVPTTAASKIFAVFVVLLGYAVLSLVTAAIAAMWVENRVESGERRMERDILRDLHAELAELRREIAELRSPPKT